MRIVIISMLTILAVISFANDSIEVEKPVLIEDDGSISSGESVNLKVYSSNEIDELHNRNSLPYFSLLLPGLAHHKLNRKNSAKVYMFAEGALWVGFAYSLFYRSKVTDNLRAYLFTYGRCDGIRSDAANKTAWNLTEMELQLPLYNDSSAQYATRVYKPSRDKSMPAPDFYWSWTSEEAHQEYYDMWKTRNTAKIVALSFAGAAVLNRVGSFIHARWIAKNSDTVTGSVQTIFWKPIATGNGHGLELSVVF